MSSAVATTETPAPQHAWADEVREMLQRGIRTFSLVAIVIFLVFWAVDWVVYPPSEFPGVVDHFLSLRVLCAMVYVPIWLWARRARPASSLVVVSALAVWWVSFIICVMLTYTGFEKSLYYAGLIVTMLAAGLIMPWAWRTASVVGVGMAGMYFGVALLDPNPHWRTTLNNTFFILGGLGISIAANAQRLKLAKAEFEGRHELAAALDKLRALDHMKTTFMANVSHEMRTPLTLMLGALETLAGTDRARRDPSEVEYLDVIRRNGLGLLRLINDLLDLARLEASQARLRLEQVDLVELLRGIASQAAPMAGWRGLTLRTSLPEGGMPISIDVQKIEKVVLNLVSNAIKFTPEGGTIQLALEGDADEVRLIVADSGIGIPAAEHERIFERFSQVDPSATRSRGGTGIGLALVKEFVELHGGSVSVASEAEKGSTFTVRLKRTSDELPTDVVDRRQAAVSDLTRRRRAEDSGLGAWVQSVTSEPAYRYGELFEAADRRGVDRVEAPPRAATVLVVEDSAELKRFITLQLSRDYRVVTACDGVDGLERAREHRPDLVITDWMMPRRDGPSLCRELRRHEETRAVPIVMLTARGQADDRATARDSGADVYLHKPFSVKELRAVVRSLLKRKEERVDELQRETGSSLMILTGGMAHEILNPLGFISNSLFTLGEVVEDLLATSPDAGVGPGSNAETCRRLLSASRVGVDRIRGVVDYLRAMARPGTEIAPECADLNQALVSTLLLTGSLSNPNVEVVQDLAEDATVRCRIGRINQVLLNLVKNALLALPASGGRVWVTTRREPEHVAIVIADNGCGIPANQIDRVFDPFFTSRAPGEGSGLGLALTRQIVEEHGGHVAIQSIPGEGTSVTVRLPLAGPRERAHDEAEAPPVSLPTAPDAAA